MQASAARSTAPVLTMRPSRFATPMSCSLRIVSASADLPRLRGRSLTGESTGEASHLSAATLKQLSRRDLLAVHGLVGLPGERVQAERRAGLAAGDADAGADHGRGSVDVDRPADLGAQPAGARPRCPLA